MTGGKGRPVCSRFASIWKLRGVKETAGAYACAYDHCKGQGMGQSDGGLAGLSPHTRTVRGVRLNNRRERAEALPPQRFFTDPGRATMARRLSVSARPAGSASQRYRGLSRPGFGRMPRPKLQISQRTQRPCSSSARMTQSSVSSGIPCCPRKRLSWAACSCT